MARICLLLGMSRSGYYAARQRPPPADTVLALREAPRADTHRYDRLRLSGVTDTREGGYVH